MMKKKVVDHRINWPVTILLIIGCVTIFFPLYMAVIIAFKQPSEMTNDIAGALSLPSAFSFSNFTEAMRVTDFWHSLGNSLMLTIITVILTMLIHSLAGYAIGRSMARSKAYNFVYLYLVSGMFVPFAILMMPLIKQTAQMGIANRAGVVILYVVFYIPMNLLLYTGYLKKHPPCAGRGGTGRRFHHLAYVLEDHLPHHEAHARHSGCSDRPGGVERRYDSSGHHVRNRIEYPAFGAAEFPDSVRNQL